METKLLGCLVYAVFFSARASASSLNSGEYCFRIVFFVLVSFVMVHLCSVVYSLNRVSISGGQDQSAADYRSARSGARR